MEARTQNALLTMYIERSTQCSQIFGSTRLGYSRMNLVPLPMPISVITPMRRRKDLFVTAFERLFESTKISPFPFRMKL